MYEFSNIGWFLRSHRRWVPASRLPSKLTTRDCLLDDACKCPGNRLSNRYSTHPPFCCGRDRATATRLSVRSTTPRRVFISPSTIEHAVSSEVSTVNSGRSTRRVFVHREIRNHGVQTLTQSTTSTSESPSLPQTSDQCGYDRRPRSCSPRSDYRSHESIAVGFRQFVLIRADVIEQVYAPESLSASVATIVPLTRTSLQRHARNRFPRTSHAPVVIRGRDSTLTGERIRERASQICYSSPDCRRVGSSMSLIRPPSTDVPTTRSTFERERPNCRPRVRDPPSSKPSGVTLSTTLLTPPDHICVENGSGSRHCPCEFASNTNVPFSLC